MVTCEWPTEDTPHLASFIVRQVNALRKAGVDVDVFPFRGAKNPLNYLKAWREAHQKLRHGAYDLVHAQWGQSAFVALLTRLPLVVTERGGDGLTAVGYLLLAIGWLIAQRADEVVVVSSHLARYLPRRSFHVIPSGLDFSRLPLIPRDEARRELGLPASKSLVLFVGNPAEERKRFPLAQDVVSRLPEELNAELVVAWRVPHDRVPVYMNACDALLFTSRWEGSPNVIKESLACNLPIVSTDVGDVRERLKDVEGCVVCSGGDPAAMATALATVLRQHERSDSRSGVRHLDDDRLAEQMIDVYRRAIANSARASKTHQKGTPVVGAGALDR